VFLILFSAYLRLGLLFSFSEGKQEKDSHGQYAVDESTELQLNKNVI
jgi:hypothetical protein